MVWVDRSTWMFTAASAGAAQRPRPISIAASTPLKRMGRILRGARRLTTAMIKLARRPVKAGLETRFMVPGRSCWSGTPAGT